MGSPAITQVARSVPFDNTSNGFPSTATNVQAAIESALAFDPQASAAVLFDDFYNDITWSPSTAGVGAAASTSGGNSVMASGKHLGVASLTLGTAIPSHASLVQSGNLSISTVFGNGKAEYKTLIYIPTLATATEDYVFRCGYGTATNADHADGIYFEYDRSQSTDWRIKTASNSSRTVGTITTAVAVAAGSWITLYWSVNEAGTNVDFYVNGTLTGSITTNIPTTTGRGSGPNYQMTNTLGSLATKIVYIDYFWFTKLFTARD